MRRIAAPLVAILATFAIGEAALRFFVHAAPQLEVDIYQREPDGRLGLRPNLARRHVTPLWDVEIRTNARGRRDSTDLAGDEADEVRGTVVLGLGDSQAFGWGVEEDEAFYSLVENLAPALTVVNAAVPGAGPPDYLRAFRALAPDVRPDVVVVSIFVGNDFSEAARGGADQFEVERGLLVRRNDEATSLTRRMRDWAARRSHVLQLIRAAQFNLQRGWVGRRQRVWDEHMQEFAGAHLHEGDEAVDRGYAATAEALRSIRADAARMAVLAVPRSWQIDESELREMQQALGVSNEALRLDRPQEFLRDWCESHGVVFVDPLPRMRAARADGRLFHAPDAHLAPAGHALVAEALAETLIEAIQP